MPAVGVAIAIASITYSVQSFVQSGDWRHLGALFIGGAPGSVYLNSKAARKAKQQARYQAYLQRQEAVTKYVTQSAVSNHQIIYGKTKIAGVETFRAFVDEGHVRTVGSSTGSTTGTGGKNRFFHYIQTLACHEIEGVEEYYLNDKKITIDSDGWCTDADTTITLDHTNMYTVKIKIFTGTDSQAASSDLITYCPKLWTDKHQGKGIAYAVITVVTDKWADGFPKFTFLVKGKKVFDPRTNTTAWSDNWALCVNDYLVNEKYGFAINQNRIDSDYLEAAANLSDELVSVKGFGINYFENARDLTNASWAKSNLSVTTFSSHADEGFDFTRQAGKLVPNTSNTTHFVKQVQAMTSGDKYEISLKAKGSGYNIFAVVCGNAARTVKIDLSNGAVLVQGGSVLSVSVVDAGNSYYHIKVTFAAHTTGDVDLSYYVCSPSDTTGTSIASFAANGTSGILIDDSKLRIAQQKRYVTNGIVDTGNKLIDNIEDLLSGGVGTLTYLIEGKFILIGGSFQTPTIEINSDWLANSYPKIKPRKARNELINGVRGVLSDAEKNFATTDFPLVKSASYITDDGEELFADIELPLVSDAQQAQRIAKILLEKNRQEITLELSLNYKGLKIFAGLIVGVTLDEMGWSNKPFRVVKWEYQSLSTINVVLEEEASSSYNWASVDSVVVDSSPDTALPNPNIVAAATGLTLSSGTSDLYIREDGSIFSRIKLVWDAPQDLYVRLGRIEIQYKQSALSNWEQFGFVGGTEELAYILDVQDGVAYDVRIRAINSIGKFSDWLTVTNHVVIGKTEAPSNVPFFSVSQRDEGVIFRWDKIDDKDISGYSIRYGDISIVHWNDLKELTFATKGTAITTLAVPPGTYKFCIKAIDTSKNESATEYCQTFTVENRNYDLINEVQEAPYFSQIQYSNVYSFDLRNISTPETLNLSSSLCPDYLDDPNSSTSVFSLRLRFRCNDIPPSGKLYYIISNGGHTTARRGFTILVNENGQVIAYLRGANPANFSFTSSSSNNAITAKKWYDLLITYDGTNLKINDIEANTTIATSTITLGATVGSVIDTKIGSNGNAVIVQNAFLGDIAMIAAWGRVVTNSQALAYDSLNLDLLFNPATNTINDQSGNSRNLTVSSGDITQILNSNRIADFRKDANVNFVKNNLKDSITPRGTKTVRNTTGDWKTGIIPIAERFSSYEYEANSIDLGIKNNVRAWADISFITQPDEENQPAVNTFLRSKDNLVDSFSAYENWIIGFRNARFFQYKLTLDITKSLPIITQFKQTLDIEERVERIGGVVVAASGSSFTFSSLGIAPNFYQTPLVEATIENASQNLTPVITSRTTSGFVINIYNTSNSSVGGTVTLTISGI